MTTVRSLSIALSGVLGILACQQPPSAAAGPSSALLGTWSLVSWEVTDSEGETSYPFGPSPEGQIIYAESGHMSVHLMHRELRVEDVTGVDDNDLVGRVARTFIAYYGTYSIDADASSVTHHVQGSLRPSMRGTDQVRGFELLDPDRVRLSALRGGSAPGATTSPGLNELIWERVR